MNDGQVPSVWACYRFAAKLRAHPALLEQCGESLAAAARAVVPGCGTKLALTSIDVPAFPNGHRTTIWAGQIVDRTSHPDANRGPVASAISRSDRMIYGYKLRAAVCQRTGLPLAWRFTPTRVPTRRFPVVPLPDLGPCANLAPERVRFRLRNPIPARPGRRGTRNRAVPFGTRGRPSARLLVDPGLTVRPPPPAKFKKKIKYNILFQICSFA